MSGERPVSRLAGLRPAKVANALTSASVGSTPLSAGIALVAATSTGMFLSGMGTAIASLGAAVVVVGAVTGSRSLVSAGAAVSLSGIVFAATAGPGAHELRFLIATTTTLVAWDAGRYGITVKEQLGRDAETVRIEAAHAAISAITGLTGLLIGYAAYLTVDGGGSVGAYALLTAGIVVLSVALDGVTETRSHSSPRDRR